MELKPGNEQHVIFIKLKSTHVVLKVEIYWFSETEPIKIPEKLQEL